MCWKYCLFLSWMRNFKDNINIIITLTVISKCKHIFSAAGACCYMRWAFLCGRLILSFSCTAFNGQAGPGLCVVVCMIRYAIHGFRLVSFSRAPLSRFNSVLIERRKKVSVFSLRKPLLVSSDESWLILCDCDFCSNIFPKQAIWT